MNYAKMSPGHRVCMTNMKCPHSIRILYNYYFFLVNNSKQVIANTEIETRTKRRTAEGPHGYRPYMPKVKVWTQNVI